MAQPSKKVNINDERDVRIGKLEDLAALGIAGFPARVSRTHTVAEALGEAHGANVIVTGRIMFKREIGKVTFCNLRDESGSVQLVFKEDVLGEEFYSLFVKKIDGADIIGVSGERLATKTGEESVMVSSWTLLSKALLPLPDKFHGLSDEETRYRKRYLDYLINPDQREKILVRSKIVRLMREFLHDKGFVEVETPILETVASGAMAKTFDTYLNAFDLPVHLRIALGELWQKRLLVGGFEKTFEIGRAFRNEGVDYQHNPEFTMIEFYWAYADYEDNMQLHEEMLPFIIRGAVGDLHMTRDGVDLDFTPPYPRVTFHDAVLENSGIDIDKYETIEALRDVMKKKGYEIDGITERGKLLDSLYKETTRPKLVQPTFVLNYPVELKPLAKRAEDPRYTEMFQLIVQGFELSNSYTELNDPIDQRARFEAQAENKAGGDEEAMAFDHDYVEALEHGMPPATGTGIGIDRFAALLTDSHTLREVTLFPLMKPLGSDKKKRDRDVFVAQAVILNDPARPMWTQFNTAAHLSAALGARLGHTLFRLAKTGSKDGVAFPMNIERAIIMKEAKTTEELHVLKRDAEKAGLHIEVFTEDMLASNNDLKVDEAHKSKLFDEINILGVLVYGEREQVKAVADRFPMKA